jgi:hypothetical protein
MLTAPRKPFNCWIDPDGKVYSVPCFGHAYFALELFVELFPDDASDWLMERGWARISMFSPNSSAIVFVLNELRVPKNLLNGIYEAYNMCEHEEIRQWLDIHGYFDEKR